MREQDRQPSGGDWSPLCAGCSEPLPDDADACPACGTPRLRTLDESPRPSCPSCTAPIPPGAAACLACGAPVYARNSVRRWLAVVDGEIAPESAGELFKAMAAEIVIMLLLFIPIGLIVLPAMFYFGGGTVLAVIFAIVAVANVRLLVARFRRKRLLRRKPRSFQ